MMGNKVTDLTPLDGMQLQYMAHYGGVVKFPSCREIRHLRRAMGKGGGYILAPAKPLRSETPTANAVAVVEEFLDNQASVNRTR